jgi:hypothetical protein
MTIMWNGWRGQWQIEKLEEGGVPSETFLSDIHFIAFSPNSTSFSDSVFRSTISNMTERIFIKRTNAWLKKELAFIAKG